MKSLRDTAAVILFLVGLAVAVHVLTDCAPNVARPAAYGAELEECSRKAATCDESISCENKVRVRYGRPLRTGGCDQ